MFEVRNGPFLPCRVMSSPTRPGDVTPGLVRGYLADHPDVSAVGLSGAFLERRPGSDVAEWRQLDQDLEAAGIPVYFTQGGTASWEAKFFVASAVPSTEAPKLRPPPAEEVPESVPVAALDGDIAGEPPAPIPVVTPGRPTWKTPQRVLQPFPAAQGAAEGIPVDVRIGYLTALGHSTRKVAELLGLEGYGPVSHMKVTRTRRRRQGEKAQMPLWDAATTVAPN